MTTLISKQQHIAERCKQIADLIQQLATQDLTAEQKADIVHNINVHKAIIKQFESAK